MRNVVLPIGKTPRKGVGALPPQRAVTVEAMTEGLMILIVFIVLATVALGVWAALTIVIGCEQRRRNINTAPAIDVISVADILGVPVKSILNPHTEDDD